MKLLRGFTDPAAYSGGFIAIGNFDGVHLGHQQILSALVEQARAAGGPSVVITFDPPPVVLLAPGRVPPRLTTLEHKAELIADCGAEVLIAYPTDHELLNLSPREFFDRIILGELHARGLVEGANFCFGRDRAGDVATLRELCRAAGLSLQIVGDVTHDGTVVSSSAIRRAVGEGRMADASSMLGRPYRLTGTVATGAGRGRTIGFPTANLVDVETMFPPDGVYAGLSMVDQKKHAAAVHLGPNPTFAEGARKLEVHLLDYSGDLYGRTLSIDLLDRIRDTMRFPDAAALTSQLGRDVAAVRRICERAS